MKETVRELAEIGFLVVAILAVPSIAAGVMSFLSI